MNTQANPRASAFRHRRALLRLLGGGGLLWPLAGCGPGAGGGFPAGGEPRVSGSPAAQQALLALYGQVRNAGENTVVVYGAAVDAEWEALWLDFQADFPGMRVVYMHVSPTQVMPRIDAEARAGNRQGDLMMQPVNVMPLIARRGYFEAFSPATAEGLDAQYRDAGAFVHYPFFKVFGLGYNTRLVREDELPARFDDVLQPRWHERFSYVKPVTAVGTTDVAFAVLLRQGALDRARLERLHRAGLFTGPDAGVTYVSQGRLALNLWSYLAVVARQRELGAPVAIRFVPDFSLNVPFGFGVIGGAPHPLAARLLKSWLFSPRGQAALASKAYMLGTMPDAPSPPFYPQAAAERARFHPRPPPEALLRELDTQRAMLRDIFHRPRSL